MIQYKQPKEIISIQSVLRHYKVKTTKKGTELTAECPFCTGVFKASLETNSFYCLSCETKGGIVDFVIKKDNISIKEAATKLFETFLEEPKPRVPLLARLKHAVFG